MIRCARQGYSVTLVVWWLLGFDVRSPSRCSLQPGVFTTPYPYWHQMGLPHTTSNDELVENALYRVRGFTLPSALCICAAIGTVRRSGHVFRMWILICYISISIAARTPSQAGDCTARHCRHHHRARSRRGRLHPCSEGLPRRPPPHLRREQHAPDCGRGPDWLWPDRKELVCRRL